jgi:glutamine cyclotransferase
MENIYLESSKYTPEIKTDLEKGEVKIYGSSYPENANEFYRPLTTWIDEYFAEGNTKLGVNFYIYYFNTSTSKSFLNLLEILEKYALEGKDILVNWYYTTEDEDSLDSGERLLMDLELNYKLIPVSEI